MTIPFSLPPREAAIHEPAQSMDSAQRAMAASRAEFLIARCLRRRSVQVVALVVGTTINFYGQILVPAMRGIDRPVTAFADEFGRHPGITLLTLGLAYLFPLAVGVYSSARALRLDEEVLARADLTDRKPDPVLRAGRDGRILVTGARTRRLLADQGIDRAWQLVGTSLWIRMIDGAEPAYGNHIFSPLDGRTYVVSHVAGPAGCVDIHFARLHPTAVDRHG